MDSRKMKQNIPSHSVPNIVFFQVLGNGSYGGSRSLYLHTDHGRYLFNCGEGTQRLASEYCPPKVLTQLSNIFITHRSWKNIGGLPGMCLSIRSAGAPEVTVHSPNGCKELYGALNKMVLLHEFVIDRTTNELFEDNALIINCILLKYHGPDEHPAIPKYSPWNPSSTIDESCTGFRTSFSNFQENMKSGKAIDQSAVAFIVTIKGKRGKLKMDKCAELGVTPGPILGKLKNGEDVTLENGKFVKHCDVVGTAEEPSKYLIIEVPSKHYLQDLQTNNKLTDVTKEDLLKIVFHFTPKEVTRSETYQRWMEKFSSNVEHIMLNEENLDNGNQSSLNFTSKLHLVNNRIFPLLQNPKVKEIDLKLNGPVYNCQTGVKFHVKPLQNFDDSLIIQSNIDDIHKELLEIQNFQPDLDKALRVIDKSAELFPKVIFLGTGASTPSIYRSLSAILLEVEENKFMMLDCGQGTLIQMHRHFGKEGAMGILRNLKAIFVSHLHVDHHLGLVGLVQGRSDAFRDINKHPEKLFIIAPHRISEFLSPYHWEMESILDDLYQIRSEHLLLFEEPESKRDLRDQIYPEIPTIDQSILKEVLGDLSLKSIVTTRAVHNPNAFCMALITQNDFKIVYTGDTRPNPALIELGKYEQIPDLLIHEATMEHYMLEDAKMKRHSTFTEAIEDAELMNAKFIILTHFSQRYTKLPLLEEIEERNNVGIAFDHLIVTPQTMKLIPFMYDALKRLFAGELSEMQTRKNECMHKNKSFVKS